MSFYHIGRKHAENRIIPDRGKRLSGGIQVEFAALAQRQQTSNLVDFCSGQDHRSNRATPGTLFRGENRWALNRGAKIRQSIYKTPTATVSQNGDPRLSSWFDF